MLKEIVTGRFIDIGEIHTSNVTGKSAFILGGHVANGTDYAIARYIGEDIPRKILAKNFGLYNG